MLRTGRGKFCSVSCRAKYYAKERRIWENLPKIPWNKGKKNSQKGWSKGLKVPKIAEKLRGNKNSLEHRHSEATKRIISQKLKGRKVSEEQREYFRKLYAGKKIKGKWLENLRKNHPRGEKNGSWKGGVSKLNKTERQLAMETLQYKEWRKIVFERDKYTCQICGIKNIKFHADHIKPWALYPKLRYELTNGRTLCIACHIKTDTYGGKILYISGKEGI